MSLYGMTCDGKKENTKFVKNFNPKTRFSKLWFSSFKVEELYAKINQYVDDLKKSKINIPELLKISYQKNQIEIEQEWIPGENISSLLSKLDQNCLINLYSNLLQMQKSAYNLNKMLRIDLNIDNFILKDHAVFLVDITPPLYLNTLNYPDTFVDQCYFHLCFSRINQISELLFSFLKKTCLSKENKEILKTLLDVLILETNAIWGNEFGDIKGHLKKIDPYNYNSSNRTLARLKLIDDFCNDKIQFDTMLQLIRKMSITYLLEQT